MQLGAVIFDLDGVLVSTDDLHYQGWKRLADEEGIPFDETVNHRLRGVSRMESLEILLERSKGTYTPEEKEALAGRKNRYYRDLLQSIAPGDVLPGALELCSGLRERGIKLAIASSSRNSPLILEKTGLAKWFDATADGNDIQRSKPDPQVFLLAASRLGIAPENCLVVEDAASGVEGAVSGGFRCLAVGAAQEHPGADWSAPNLAGVSAERLIDLLSACAITPSFSSKLTGSSKTLNIGLIGCGGRLRDVVGRLLAQDAEGRIRVLSAFDPDPASYQAAREQFGPDCLARDSEQALVTDPAIDWVFIGSWNCFHARQAVLALSAGKHVFCEKPLATTVEDCVALREAARKSGSTFVFGLVLRYSPHYQRIMEVIRSGAIGRIISFEFNETLGFNHGGYIFGNWRRERRHSGTHILEKCCHDLDLANWIVGSLPVRVASFGGRNFFIPRNAGEVGRIGPDETGTPAYMGWVDPHRQNPFDGQGDICDNQVAILEYANGVRGVFHTNCNAATPERRFYICGTRGTLRADVVARTFEVQRIGWDSKIERIDLQAQGSGQVAHGGGDDVMAGALAETLLHGAVPLASVEEGIKSAVVAFGIDQALDEGRVVDLHAMWDQVDIDPSVSEHSG